MDHTAAQSKFAAPGRLAGLDGLRGLAACAVAFGFHAQFLFVKDTIPAGTGWFIGDWLRENGWLAVDLFFVLSGFVFAHIYLAGAPTDRIDWRDFAVARLARLYPLHLLTLLFCLVTLGHWAANTHWAFAAHLVMAQALYPPTGHTFNGPSWSITVEMICYALFLLGVKAGRRWLLFVTLAAIIVGLLGIQTNPGGTALTASYALARGLLGFFMGQALWHCRQRLSQIPVVVLIGAALAALLVDPGPLNPVLPLTLLGWPALLLLALRLKLFRARPLVWLGDRSYAIYLIHMPLTDMVHDLSGGGLMPSPLLVAGATAVLTVLTLALADLSWRCFEQPARWAVLNAWQRRKTAANLRRVSA